MPTMVYVTFFPSKNQMKSFLGKFLDNADEKKKTARIEILYIQGVKHNVLEFDKKIMIIKSICGSYH
jgi:hypothetical protein